MTIVEMLNEARSNIGNYCKVCPVCDGRACRGMIPGPGGKGLGLGFLRNYEDLRRYALEMDTIHQSMAPDTSSEFFGLQLKAPVFAAPIGGVNLHYSGLYDDLTFSEAIVNGCHQAGILGFTGDGVKDEVYMGAVEAIKRNCGVGVPTIKPWSVDEVIAKGLAAKEAGVPAMAMDIDAAGLSILAAQGKPVSPLSVDQLKEIKKAVGMPLILKGIMTKKGAFKALEAGADGIIVSNHGGRVLDETPSGMAVLPEIVDVVAGRMRIMVDGGFRSGTDVFKALALGADGVLIGRPFAIAVYGAGEAGVVLYAEKIVNELKDAMLMTGARCLADIDMTKIRCLR